MKKSDEMFVRRIILMLAGILFISLSVGPVSYTHLDVYKRQVLESAMLNLKNGSQIGAQEMREERSEGNTGKYRILWESVVNVEESESISLNGTVISL